ncbi:MAG: hypothetical protein K2N23_01420 [Clostridia bacterium]|nr:hypothetical protein [Clostridia bacterium]
MAQERFKSRGGFILACVGAAVGLGDSLRFPGLCAKYGGGTFMFIYIVALLLIGIPVLNAEIALGRKLRAGAPKCMASLNKRGEGLGWASCFNSLGVAVLYAGMLGWIITMIIKIVPLCKNSTSMTRAETGGYFFDSVLTSFSPLVLICIIAAWVLMYLCLRNGADSLSKTAKFTVLIPVVLLTVMAVRGLIYSNSGKALYALFVPDFSAFADAELWLSAVGQVFFSLSVLVGIMPAYGAYLPDGESVLKDSLIIALSDFFVSVLSAVVLFTTLYGCGLENEFSSSGIVTAFMVYPVALSQLFGAGNTVLNSIAGLLFYLSLGMMALQSSASMVEAAANPLADKFSLNKKKLTMFIALIGAGICLVFSTNIGPVVLDVADHFLNYFNILLLGVFECALLGMNVKRINLVGEINRYSGKMRMPEKPLVLSLKYLSPAVLSVLFVWGIYHLIFIDKGIYGGYSAWAQVLGWVLSALVFACGIAVGSKLRLKREAAH